MAPGCERVWYLSVIRHDAKQPVFCISRWANCKGDDVSLAFIGIDEVNQDGLPIKAMWVIEPTSNVHIKELTYGTVPAGYKETYPMVPLEMNKIYAVQLKYYFRIKQVNDRVEVEVFDRGEFDRITQKSAQS